MNYQEIKAEDLEASPTLKGNFEDKLHIYQGHYIVRSKVNNDAPFYSSGNESRMLSTAEELGIAPKLVSLDKDGNLICERLEDVSAFSGNKEELKQVISSLAKLHSSKVFMKFYEPFARYRHYKALARGDSKEVDKNNQPKEIFVNEEREKKLILELEPYYLKEKLVPCHNFLSKENILIGKDGAKFVDYSFAALNLKEYDLSSFLVENDLLSQEEDILKEYYQGEYSKEKERLVHLFAEFQNYLGYYYAKKRYFETKDGFWDAKTAEKKTKIENFR